MAKSFNPPKSRSSPVKQEFVFYVVCLQDIGEFGIILVLPYASYLDLHVPRNVHIVMYVLVSMSMVITWLKTSKIHTLSDDPYQRPIKIVETSSDWQVLINHLTESISSHIRVVLVCGPKGSGKSTFSRLLVNAFLARSKSVPSSTGVAYLDLDPGQPEFSPPGEVSLFHLRSYILSPPFAHPMVNGHLGDQVVKAHHVGALTPRDDPSHYTECAMDLAQCYQQLLHGYPSCPLVINSSGWILGHGLEILIDLIQTPMLTDVVYMSTTGPEEIVRELVQVAHLVHVPFHTLRSQPSRYVTRTAADLRGMQSLSYFHLDMIDEINLRWDPSPLKFSYSSEFRYTGVHQDFLGIMVLGQVLDPNCLADLIDGSVLGVVAIDANSTLSSQAKVPDSAAGMFKNGLIIQQDHDRITSTTCVTKPSSRDGQDLCNNRLWSHFASIFSEDRQGLPHSTLDPASVCRTEEDLPYLFHGAGACMPLDPSRSHSLGQVLVRGIDRDKKVLRIFTPIPSQTFRKYREARIQIVLVRGKLDTPTWAYQEECTAALTKEKSRVEGGIGPENKLEEVRGEGDADLGIGFNLEAWAKRKPWVRANRGREDRHRRDKVWKARRNLQV